MVIVKYIDDNMREVTKEFKELIKHKEGFFVAVKRNNHIEEINFEDMISIDGKKFEWE